MLEASLLPRDVPRDLPPPSGHTNEAGVRFGQIPTGARPAWYEMHWRRSSPDDAAISTLASTRRCPAEMQQVEP
jgi:hypothetical protein